MFMVNHTKTILPCMYDIIRQGGICSTPFQMLTSTPGPTYQSRNIERAIGRKELGRVDAMQNTKSLFRALLLACLLETKHV